MNWLSVSDALRTLVCGVMIEIAINADRRLSTGHSESFDYVQYRQYTKCMRVRMVHSVQYVLYTECIQNIQYMECGLGPIGKICAVTSRLGKETSFTKRVPAKRSTIRVYEWYFMVSHRMSQFSRCSIAFHCELLHIETIHSLTN